MRTRGCLKGALLSALVIASLILSVSHVARAQFEVSPGDFTTYPIPPSGSDVKLAQELSIWNGDNTKRSFSVYAVIPPEDMVGEGFEPIPDESWLFVIDDLIEIEENSSKLVELWANIPRWENLTDKRWEAWIRVERIAEPGEIAELRVDVTARIVTATGLPGPPSPSSPLLTSLKISDENLALQADESKYLTATLTSDGSPVADKLITWSVNAGTIAPSSGKTDTAGQVTVVYKAPSYETYVIVSASYAGSVQYEPRSVNSYVTITEPPTGISMELVIGIPIVIGCAVIIAALYVRRRKPTEFRW